MPAAATLGLLAVPVLVGTGLLLLATSRLGLGVSHDSVIYLDAAQTLSVTGTLARPTPDGRLTPVTHYPPLYPSLLASLGSSIRQIHARARPLNVALFGATLLLVAALAYQCGRKSVVLAVVSCTLAAVSLDLLVVYSRVWSESVFLALTSGGLLLFLRYLRRPAWPRLGLAAVPLALAWLARYAGVAAIPTGALAVWVFVRRDAPARIRHLVLYGLAVGSPILYVLMRNVSRTGNPTDRSAGFHGLTSADLSELVETVGGWLVPASVPVPVQMLAAGVLLGFAGWCARVAWRRRTQVETGSFDPIPASTLWLFVGAYVCSVLFAKMFVDPAIPLESRTFSPVLLMLLVLVPAHLRDAVRGANARIVLLVALAAVTGFQTLRAIRWATAARVTGLHYNTAEWERAEAPELVTQAPACATVYANNPELIYWLTGRRAWSTDPAVGSPLTAHLARLRGASDASASPLMVVLIRDFEEDGTTERLLDADPQLTPAWRDETASVYVSPPAPACRWGF